MSEKLLVFVSSVQKELEDERLIVQNLLNTDPFLSAHCTPVLYEYEPASPDKALEGCLKYLDRCQEKSTDNRPTNSRKRPTKKPDLSSSGRMESSAFKPCGGRQQSPRKSPRKSGMYWKPSEAR